MTDQNDFIELTKDKCLNMAGLHQSVCNVDVMCVYTAGGDILNSPVALKMSPCVLVVVQLSLEQLRHLTRELSQIGRDLCTFNHLAFNTDNRLNPWCCRPTQSRTLSRLFICLALYKKKEHNVP